MLCLCATMSVGDGHVFRKFRRRCCLFEGFDVLIDVLTDYLHIHRGGRQHQSIYQYQNIISIQYSVSSRVGFCMSFFKNQCSFENKMKGLAIPCPPIPNGNPAARPMSQARLLRSALSTFKKSNSLHADAGMMGWR